MTSPHPAPDAAPPEPALEPAVLAYPCGEPPPPGGTREIVPGVLWLRMPLPFSLQHINLWLLEDGAGWAVVDTKSLK